MPSNSTSTSWVKVHHALIACPGSTDGKSGKPVTCHNTYCCRACGACKMVFILKPDPGLWSSDLMPSWHQVKWSQSWAGFQYQNHLSKKRDSRDKDDMNFIMGITILVRIFTLKQLHEYCPSANYWLPKTSLIYCARQNLVDILEYIFKIYFSILDSNFTKFVLRVLSADIKNHLLEVMMAWFQSGAKSSLDPMLTQSSDVCIWNKHFDSTWTANVHWNGQYIVNIYSPNITLPWPEQGQQGK